MVQVSTLLKEGDLNIPEEFQQRLEALIQACHRHLPRVDEELIRRAFRVSYWAHRDHRRVTGEPTSCIRWKWPSSWPRISASTT
nr:hypothetical protein [Rhodothermus marinus]